MKPFTNADKELSHHLLYCHGSSDLVEEIGSFVPRPVVKIGLGKEPGLQRVQ
jgi:hypothetical protein